MALAGDSYDFPLRFRATTFPLARRDYHEDYSEPPSPFTTPHEYAMTQLSTRLREHTLDPVSTDPTSESETSSSAPSSPAWSVTLSPNLSFATDSSTPPYPSTYDLSAPSPTVTSFPATGTYHSRNVRLQRQRALRRQCSSSHLREIRALVDRLGAERMGADKTDAAKCSSDSSSTADDEENEMDVDYVEEAEGHSAAGEVEWRTPKYRRSFEGINERREARNLVREVRLRKRGRKKTVGIPR